MEYPTRSQRVATLLLASFAALHMAAANADGSTKCAAPAHCGADVRSEQANTRQTPGTSAAQTFVFNASAVPPNNVKAKDSDRSAAGNSFRFDPKATGK